MAKPTAEPFPAEGLPLEEARARVLAALRPDPPLETLPLAACLGRVMAQSVLASEAVPGFRAAILDGYAVADAMPPEPGRRWRVVGRSAAGMPYPQPMGEEEAVRILTGAPLPEGAARVLAQEQVEVQGSGCSSRRSLARSPGSVPPMRRRRRGSCWWRPASASGPPIWVGWRAVVWRCCRWRPGRGLAC